MHGLRKLPEKLGAHRTAAFALYRALLSQCTKLPLDSTAKEQLQHVVRNRFRVPRPTRLGLQLAFESGYTALDLLDASVAGDVSATTRISDYIERIPSKLKLPREAPAPKPKDPRHAATPEPYKLETMFPRKQVEGARKVPYLVNAAGLPFIRWKKPQPLNVTRVLKAKIMQRQRRKDEMEAIDDEIMPMAAAEDEWENLVRGQYYREENEGTLSPDAAADLQNSKKFETQYKDAIKEYKDQLYQDSQAADASTIARSQRFTEIVLEERRLARDERAARKAAARARWEASQDTEIA